MYYVIDVSVINTNITNCTAATKCAITDRYIKPLMSLSSISPTVAAVTLVIFGYGCVDMYYIIDISVINTNITNCTAATKCAITDRYIKPMISLSSISPMIAAVTLVIFGYGCVDMYYLNDVSVINTNITNSTATTNGDIDDRYIIDMISLPSTSLMVAAVQLVILALTTETS
jgi:hypothetical protein